MSDTVFYSRRSCPYCMRAHMALRYAGIKAELREVDLKNYPPQALAISPNASIPVMLLPDGRVIDESWDIIKWALEKNDPDNWRGDNGEYMLDAEILIETNDFSFKEDLEHYKYAERYPEYTAEHYRQVCEEFIEELEEMLTEHRFLLAEQLSLADIGVFPFIRQFALVDKKWFSAAPYPRVRQWLNGLIKTELFRHVFQKHDIWREGAAVVFI